MANIPEAVFVVLSDLHFGDDLMREAEGPLPSVPWWLRALDYDVKCFFEKRCSAHDIGILKTLPRYLKSLFSDLRRSGYSGHDGKDFDLYLLLGDHSTRPTGSSYRFLREYLTAKRYVTGSSDLRHSCAGLRIDPSILVMIPGNHDKLLLTNLDFYHNEALKPIGLPAQPKMGDCWLTLRSIGARKFLFVLVDASKYAATNDRLDLSCHEHLAGGEISSRLKASIVSKIERLTKGISVDGVDGRDYDAATRILVVHYAVDTRKVSGLSQELNALILPHDCKGLDELVNELSHVFHLVVHGHLHKPMIYRQGSVPVISATTTTQRGGDNGFFLLKFLASGEIAAEHHRWLSTGFLLDSRSELNQLVGRASAAP